MARAKVVDFDYYQFIGLLRRATDAGKRIDKSDDKRWADYIKAKGINEVAATAIARESLGFIWAIARAAAPDAA